MGTGSHSETLSVGGFLMQRTVTKTADGEAHYGPIALTTPSLVSSWVKSDADTAAGDVPAGSTIPVGASTVDVYWSGGMRYGVSCTRTTNALALDGGTGTDFPESADTTVVVAQQQQVNIPIDGDLAELVGLLATVPGHADLQDAADDSIRAVSLTASVPDMWDSDQATNVYMGDVIAKALVTAGTLAWVTSTAYAVGDIVQSSSKTYKCLVAHTSGTFATDLAAGDWVEVAAAYQTFEAIVLQDTTP